ncbi:MAG TPA: GNAT family N-acetyltransferase [Microvirga sp.]|nr:GNAT family N-acetyltransferase [Microvirga sp.]
MQGADMDQDTNSASLPKTLRKASFEEAGEVARLHRYVVRTCLPFLPDLHTPEEDLWYFTNRFFPEHQVWVYAEGSIKGYCGFREGCVSHLYVSPEVQGKGVGSMLLRKAMEAYSPLRLWVFQRNAPAISFYERHGFRLIETTDGAGNEEKEPDALYEWIA